MTVIVQSFCTIHTNTRRLQFVNVDRKYIYIYICLRKRLARPKGHRTVCCRVKDTICCCRCRCGFQWSHIAAVASRTLTLPPAPLPPPQQPPSHLNLRYPPTTTTCYYYYNDFRSQTIIITHFIKLHIHHSCPIQFEIQS